MVTTAGVDVLWQISSCGADRETPDMASEQEHNYQEKKLSVDPELISACQCSIVPVEKYFVAFISHSCAGENTEYPGDSGCSLARNRVLQQ